MDRFAWADGVLGPEERLVIQQNGVRLYDGDNRTAFENGKLVVTTHRLLWKHHKDQKCIISMPLSYMVFAEEQSGSISKSAKIVAHLNQPSGYKPPGPQTSSQFHFIRASFKEGGHSEFYKGLTGELQAKRWEQTMQVPSAAAAPGPRKVRAGIVGIERNLQQKHKETDKSISQAFEDLSKLMTKAKEMVNLSKNISSKIRDKQGDISEDETVKFKSYLLSLGVADPVTRETHGSGMNYYRQLAKEISSVLEQPLKESGGIMTLTDAYCRINRARGMELLSPEDLVNACKQMEQLKLPIRLEIYESGVMVLQLQSHNEKQVITQTENVVQENESLTADELSRLIGLSVILAKERLLLTERAGKVCRDETVEGLRFYPNLFLGET